MLRRGFHFYWRFSRGITLGVRGLVIDEQDRVFLVKHSYVEGWHLPGGGVEVGETIADALARELSEEGNITLAGAPRFYHLYYNPHGSRRDHVALFVIREFERGPPKHGHEIIDSGFFPRTALPHDTTAGTRRRIGEVMEDVKLSDRW